MAQPGLAPRLAAVKILDAIQEDGTLMSELMPDAVAHLAADERARAGRLALTTLRWMDRADRILGPFLRNKPRLHVLNVLRLGVVELLVDKAAAHGVLNCAVSIVKLDKTTQSTSGLVNAVLRNVTRLPDDKWASLPVPRLPKWLRKQLIADFGKPGVVAMEVAHSNGAPLDLTVKSDPEKWAKALDGTVLPTGSVRLTGSVQLTALEGFENGDWWVQDAAAALPAKLLNTKPGERVLDIGAAPGGKTMQLCQTGAEVTALDMSGPRMERLHENLKRTGLTATPVVTDALHYKDEPFDAILLDAPCSATGTIRRHPDLPHAKDSSGFASLFELQEKMLDRAIDLLKPGGRLVYCTCSLLIDEGEEQIRDLLKRNNAIRIDLSARDAMGLPADWNVTEGLRTRPDYWPELGGMDGFFMTVLQKPA